MKSYIIIISCLLFSFNASAQNSNDQLAKYLSYFSTGNSFSSLGNFAAVSTANNTLNASLSFLNDNNSMYTVDIRAGATQGIATLFDEGELNSNVSIGFQYRRLFSSKSNTYIGFNIPDQKLLEQQKQKINDDFNNKKLSLFKKLNSPKPKPSPADQIVLKKYKTPSGKAIDLKTHKDLVKVLSSIDSTLAKYDSMSFIDFDNEDDNTKQLVNDLRKYRDDLIKRTDINSNVIFAEAMTQLIDERDTKLAEVTKKENELKPRFIRLNFISFGYKATNNRFVRFIDSLSPDSQLDRINYISHNVNLSYNFVSNIKNVKSNQNRDITDFKASTYRYLSIGAEFSLTDNQSSLEQVEVVDNRFTNEDNTRVVNRTQNAFFGNYLDDLSSVTVFIDYFSYFDKKKNFTAFHLNPTMIFRENVKPVANIQLGVLIPFKRRDNEKTIINVELFYRINDVFNTSNNANTLLNRNMIGLQTSFPFNIK